MPFRIKFSKLDQCPQTIHSWENQVFPGFFKGNLLMAAVLNSSSCSEETLTDYLIKYHLLHHFVVKFY